MCTICNFRCPPPHARRRLFYPLLPFWHCRHASWSSSLEVSWHCPVNKNIIILPHQAHTPQRLSVLVMDWVLSWSRHGWADFLHVLMHWCSYVLVASVDNLFFTFIPWIMKRLILPQHISQWTSYQLLPFTNQSSMFPLYATVRGNFCTRWRFSLYCKTHAHC